MRKLTILYTIAALCGVVIFFSCVLYNNSSDVYYVYLVLEEECKFTLHYHGNQSSITGPNGFIKFNEVEIEVKNCEIVKNLTKVPIVDHRKKM